MIHLCFSFPCAAFFSEQRGPGAWGKCLPKTSRFHFFSPFKDVHSLNPDRSLTDNDKASLVNASVVQSEVVSIHSVDHMCAWFLREAQLKGVNSDLVCKCWDLKDAYKQIPFSDSAYKMDSCFVSIFQTDRRLRFINKKLFLLGRLHQQQLSSDVPWPYGR